MHWDDSIIPAKKIIQIEKTQGIVNPEQSIQKLHIAGDFKNQDSYISDSSAIDKIEFWTEEDQSDIVNFSLRCAATYFPEDEFI